MPFTQNPYYLSRGNQAADAISSGVSAIAQAMLANRRNALDPAQQEELAARTRLHDAQASNYAAEQQQTADMIAAQRKAKLGGLANIFMSTGLDADQSGALAYNAMTGKNIFPDMPQLYSREQLPAINAARMTVGTDLVAEPSKAGSAGGGQNLAKVFEDALASQYIMMAGNGDLSPAQMQQINIMRSPSGNRYSNASDGVIIDQYQPVPTSAVVGNNMQNPQIKMKRDVADGQIARDRGAANQSNAAAGLNRANTTLVNTKNTSLQNNGKESALVVADANSPTGYSYTKPDGSLKIGAVLTNAGGGNKGGSGGRTGKTPELAGIFYETKDASQIDKITEKILGMDTDAPDGKPRYPLPVKAKTAIRMRVNQIAQEKGQSGKFTDADVYQAVQEINSDQPYLFQYTANMDDKGAKISPTQKNRVKEAGLSEIVVPKGVVPAPKAGGVSISNW